MTERFTTNGYYIYDHFKEDSWLVNKVEADEIVNVMNNLDIKARERSKALSKLQKENEQLKQQFKEQRHEDINELSVIAMKYKALEKENEKLKFENNELKCALALDEVDYIIADGKKIDIPPYYEFEQRYDSVMHRREYDGYD